MGAVSIEDCRRYLGLLAFKHDLLMSAANIIDYGARGHTWIDKESAGVKASSGTKADNILEASSCSSAEALAGA